MNLEAMTNLEIRPEVREKLIYNLHRIEDHDQATAEHCVRVGLLAAEVSGIHRGILAEMGFMHDMGKISVDACLLNVASVTTEQYAAIKVHTRAGYALLKDELPYSACAAGKHHPSYAVQEYPISLNGRERELIARYVPIITLCDFYDALTTRNTAKYSYIDRKDPVQVRAALEQQFPEQKQNIAKIIRE